MAQALRKHRKVSLLPHDQVSPRYCNLVNEDVMATLQFASFKNIETI